MYLKRQGESFRKWKPRYEFYTISKLIFMAFRLMSDKQTCIFLRKEFTDKRKPCHSVRYGLVSVVICLFNNPPGEYGR